MNKDFLKNFEKYVNDMPNNKFLELVNQAENLPWEYKLPENYSNIALTLLIKMIILELHKCQKILMVH